MKVISSAKRALNKFSSFLENRVDYTNLTFIAATNADTSKFSALTMSNGQFSPSRLPYIWKDLNDGCSDIAILDIPFDLMFHYSLEQVSRILKPGGYALLLDASETSSASLVQVLDCSSRVGLETFFIPFDISDTLYSPSNTAIILHKNILLSLHNPKFQFLLKDCVTFQSSSSKFESKATSSRGVGTEIYSGDFSFHTDSSYLPWLTIDMGQTYNVRNINVYNRSKFEERCLDIDIYLSKDFLNWKKIHSNKDFFGGIYDNRPIRLFCVEEARFIRIQKRSLGVLHFDQVQAYGTDINQNKASQ